MGIGYKEGVLRDEFMRLDLHNPLLWAIIQEFAAFSETMFDVDIIITSIFRPVPESSVHAHWRGVDCRSWIYSEEQIELIRLYFDSRWQYDPIRPEISTVIYHEVDNGGLHLHFQSHSRTMAVDRADFQQN